MGYESGACIAWMLFVIFALWFGGRRKDIAFVVVLSCVRFFKKIRKCFILTLKF